MITTKSSIRHSRLYYLLLPVFFLIATGYSKTLYASGIDSVKTATDSTIVKTITDTAIVKAKDTVVVKKRFWRASGEFMLAQIIPWSYNYFVRDAPFAHVTFSSIWHNLHPSSWEWDDNNFTTNQIAHPYQGNLYFNAFRSNGYSFWQAAPASFVGSFMWEIAGETHNPAPNDFINTSMGGVILGEMTYRISNRIINKKQRGFNRQADEVLGFMIDPMNGLNRLINGQWGRVSNTPLTSLDTMAISGEFDFGAREISEDNSGTFTKGKTGWYARMRLLYGSPFTPSKIPFNNFDIKVELGADDTAKLNNVSVNGLLTSWELKNNDRVDHVLSLTANYDFYHNSSFEYGSQAVNLSIYSKFNTSEGVSFTTRIGAGAVILAAVPDAYLYYGEGRNYDYGPGFSLIGQGGVLIDNRFAAIFGYKGGWFVTLNGSNSTYFLHSLTGELRYRMFGPVSIGAEAGYFILQGNYSDHPDIDKKYPYLRASIGYKI
jgi:hypothetical protein